MTTDSLPNGTVIWYPYLWSWQAERGQTEGRKHRPCCMVYSVRDQGSGKTFLFLLAVSGTPPRADQTVVEIPDIERRRAGLADWKEGWVTVSEYNVDVAEDSFYYEPTAAPLGRFSEKFVVTVAAALRKAVKRGQARVNRTL